MESGEDTKMKNRSFLGILFVTTGLLTLAAGCGRTAGGNGAGREHEPITMQSPFRNMSAFIDVVHETYPEINLEVIPYSGKNYTAYVKAQLAAGDMPDIYCATYYTPGNQQVEDKLIDLSGYAFTDNYGESYLESVTDNGAIYLLPIYFDCFGITYNKTLLEKNGWTLPNSFRELEELAPKVAAAGCRLCLNEIQLPGYGFQYWCNIMDTAYLNTLDGRLWQRRFLNNEATVAGTPKLVEQLRTLERWREIGMLNGDGDINSDNATRLMMAEGNTLFLLGSSNTFTEEETTDEFGLMPYLSEDGTQNALILNVSRYVGLNKHLEEEGNEQRLEDALHVLEVLSTVKGMQTLNSTYEDTSLLPLKEYQVSRDGYYAEIEGLLNDGVTAPFIYSGWENVIVPIGETMISFLQGTSELEDVIRAFDENQTLLADASGSCYTVITEKIETEDCARLVGICFAKATGADLALISVNKWYKLQDAGELNPDGVSGALFPLPVTDQEIVSILPTGWRQTIQTVTLTGARIRQLLQDGYEPKHDGTIFPYVLAAPEGFCLEDSKSYTAVIAGVTEEVAAEGELTDTGVLGLDAARSFFDRFETFSTKEIVWE